MATSGSSTILAGELSATVTHTFGSSSFTVQTNFTRDVGSITYTDKSATEFTVTIATVDAVDDTDFTWAILPVSDTVAPSVNQYCLVASITEMPDVPAYGELGFASEAIYEEFVSGIITKASRLIDRWTHRPTAYFNGGASITEYQDGNSYGTDGYPSTARQYTATVKYRTYRLRQSPVVSVTSVSHNTAGIGESASWTALTAYNLDNGTGELVFANTVSIYPKSSTSSKNVRFIYVAGYSAVPDEVAAACEELVSNALKKNMMDQLNSRVRFNRPSAISFSDKTVFTDDIKEMLAPYRQVRF